jgi:hypothetical protein
VLVAESLVAVAYMQTSSALRIAELGVVLEIDVPSFVAIVDTNLASFSPNGN